MIFFFKFWWFPVALILYILGEIFLKDTIENSRDIWNTLVSVISFLMILINIRVIDITSKRKQKIIISDDLGRLIKELKKHENKIKIDSPVSITVKNEISKKLNDLFYILGDEFKNHKSYKNFLKDLINNEETITSDNIKSMITTILKSTKKVIRMEEL